MEFKMITDLLCKIGLHDWETIDWNYKDSFWWGPIYTRDRVCLRCGKKSFAATESDLARKAKEAKKQERKIKGRSLWNQK